MIHVAKFTRLSIIALGVGGAAMLWSGNSPINGTGSFVSTADALIGRPATPRSFAGVARRTTGRAVAVGAAYGTAAGVAVGTAYGAAAYRATAVGAAPVVRAAPAGGCVRVIGPLGRAVTVCR